MLNAINTLEELAIILNMDDDETEELVIKAYLAVRLKPLLGIKGVTEQKLNAIANILFNAYYTKGYTLDILINTVYNYINATSKCPTNNILNNDIDMFLETYAEK